MNKLFAYSIGVGLALVFIAFGAGVYFYMKNNPNVEPTETTEPTYESGWQGGTFTPKPTTNVTPTQTPTARTATITGADGQPVVVNDFKEFEITREDPNNPGQYYLAGGEDNDTLPFTVLYVDANQSFTIALYEEPLSVVREQAEQVLMKLLGIPESEMCRLPYTVLVPIWVSEIYSGRNLGFSFCDGATVLP